MTSNVQQNSRGILFVILAMSVFSIQDVLIKFISSNVSLFQILFYRSVIGALLIIIFQRALGKRFDFGRPTLRFHYFEAYFSFLDIQPFILRNLKCRSQMRRCCF